MAKLVAVCDRAAEKPRAMTAYETNLVSWSPYIFAEVGCPTLIRPLVGLFALKERLAHHLLGGYAASDAPSIFMRLAGAETPKAFAAVLRSKDAAPELRIAPILASGAAWAHGLVDREAALAPLRAELVGYGQTRRLRKPRLRRGWTSCWTPRSTCTTAELTEELAAAARTWELDESWDEELAEALADTQQNARLRFREAYPRFDKAVEFIERWDELDDEAESGEQEAKEDELGKN